MNPVSELARKLENLCRPGTVIAVDATEARCRVESGGLTTNWLPWLALRAGADKTWWPPSEGEQVLLLCPGGNPAQGIVLLGMYSDANPAPGATLNEVIMASFRDGTLISYNTDSHELFANVHGDVRLITTGDATVVTGGDLNADAAGEATVHAATVSITADSIAITGAVSITGNVNVTGNVVATGDVLANGISLMTHTHPGVMPGPSVTGTPT